jgi:hypothetical protein
MDERFARVWDRFASDDEARSLAYATLNARLEGMNEFRAQLDKQAGTLVTREAHAHDRGPDLEARKRRRQS